MSISPSIKHVVGFVSADGNRGLGGITVDRGPRVGDLVMLAGLSRLIISVEEVDVWGARHQKSWRAGIIPAPWVQDGGWPTSWLGDPPTPPSLPALVDLLDALPKTDDDEDEDDEPGDKPKKTEYRLLVRTPDGESHEVSVLGRLPATGQSLPGYGRVQSVTPSAKRGGRYAVVCS